LVSLAGAVVKSVEVMISERKINEHHLPSCYLTIAMESGLCMDDFSLFTQEKCDFLLLG
jgi:hypothetical protein